MFSSENIDHYLTLIETDLLHWGMRVAAALAVFFIGRWVAGRLVKAQDLLFERREVDPTIARFVHNLSSAVLLVVVVLAALNQLGVQTSSMLAVLGAAGLAIGLALKDSLSNIASGVLMVAFRPFRVGDFVEVAGVTGTVDKIAVFYTELRTSDNKVVVIPNALVTSGVITNFTAAHTRRIEIKVGVSYNSDLETVRQVLLDVVRADPRVLADPAPVVGVLEFADSSINLVVRPWVKSSEYWDTFFALNVAIKRAFDARGIEIPFPQRVTHVITRNGGSDA